MATWRSFQAVLSVDRDSGVKKLARFSEIPTSSSSLRGHFHSGDRASRERLFSEKIKTTGSPVLTIATFYEFPRKRIRFLSIKFAARLTGRRGGERKYPETRFDRRIDVVEPIWRKILVFSIERISISIRTRKISSPSTFRNFDNGTFDLKSETRNRAENVKTRIE